MPKDLRSFIEDLDRSEQLIHIKRGVDPLTEMSALAWQALPNQAVLFENITGFRGWRACAGVVESRERLALALGVKPHEVLPEYSRLLSGKLIKYEEVSQGPVKEVVWKGEDVSLLKIPINKNCERDGGPYITFGETICQDPETGIHNAAILRLQIKGERKTGIYCVHGKHTWEIYRKYEERGQAMPIAVSIGHHPALHLAGTWAGPIDVDELEVTGTILGEPLRVIRCESVPLVVPADAEIVIEGEVPPGIREEEGPFAEFTGYYPRVYSEPIVNVKAITMRKDPIYEFDWSGRPGAGTALGIESYLYRRLREVEGFIDLKDVHIFPQVDHFMVVVQMIPHYDGQVKNVLLAALSGATVHVKIAVAVDEDVDIYDPADMMWAVVNRVNPERDVFIISATRNHPFDIKLPLVNSGTVPVRVGSKMGIDATKPSTNNLQARRAFDRARPVGWGRVRLEDFL